MTRSILAVRCSRTLGLSLLSALLGGAQAQGTVKIGAITSLTGRFAEFGRQQMAGFKVAVDEINRKGGVNGQKVELQVEDNASDVNKGLAAAEKLVNAGVGVVICEYSSSLVKAQSQYLARQKVPALVVTSSGDDITKPGNDYIFRLNQPATEYARVIFNIFRDNKFKTRGDDHRHRGLREIGGRRRTQLCQAVRHDPG